VGAAAAAAPEASGSGAASRTADLLSCGARSTSGDFSMLFDRTGAALAAIEVTEIAEAATSAIHFMVFLLNVPANAAAGT
jgi:uncharacterized protein YhfF